jgi:hypothetical protein
MSKPNSLLGGMTQRIGEDPKLGGSANLLADQDGIPSRDVLKRWRKLTSNSPLPARAEFLGYHLEA